MCPLKVLAPELCQLSTSQSGTRGNGHRSESGSHARPRRQSLARSRFPGCARQALDLRRWADHSWAPSLLSRMGRLDIVAHRESGLGPKNCPERGVDGTLAAGLDQRQAVHQVGVSLSAFELALHYWGHLCSQDGLLF